MSTREELEIMATKLAAHPDYRVLRRLDTTRQRPALEGPTVRRAAIVDTETTGTDPTVDKVIELAIVVVLGIALVVAVVALLDVAAKSGGPAQLDCTHDAPLGG